MFDKAEILVKAGNGGDGSVHFRREKFVPLGGPDGGDGGNGADVIIRADGAIDNLRNYRQKRSFTAQNGAGGGGRKKHGKSGENLVLKVPAGTIVTTRDEDAHETLMADLEKDGDEVTAASGGLGGRANIHFASSTNQAPHIAQRGEAGEEIMIGLEMRLIADVGIIGYPNAGKSTLLAAASAAKPKVADYPFTTLEPVLGLVEVGLESFVLAEIPGLIEGAHTGRGLGHDFLRHAMRTRIFIHIVSGDSESPIDDMLQVNEELVQFDPTMAARPQVVVLNKTDIPYVQERLPELKAELSGAGVRAHYISAATGEGVPELMAEILKVLREQVTEAEQAPVPVKVFRPQPRETRYSVTREEDGTCIVHSADLERFYCAAGVSPGELRGQIVYQLQRMGAYKALEKAGVQPGDTVKCGEVTWMW
ncbi:MAG: GTPase ObgE [Dehalococcoidales bacterium]|nr:GTPase ObgE [Dehalococcoidales bacterium]